MKKAVAGALVAVLIGAALLVPLPVLVIAPGSAVGVGERVELGRPPDPLTGRFLLTTVRIYQPTALGVVQAWLAEHQDVLAREEVVPPGVDREEFEHAQRQLFRESSEVAAAVGLQAAGEVVEVTGAGARVAAVVDGSPAEGELREGDVITAVDGQPVALASDLVAALATRAAGDDVDLTLRRDDREQHARIRLEDVERLGRPALGVAVATVDLAITLPVPVEVDQGEIGGPSAGLMVALTVYDLADPADLAAGRAVAGTGTIDLEGSVGAVGGVGAKVIAARRSGASLFLVPEDEEAEARQAAGGELEIIPVASLEEAIAALRDAA
ncbi:MAG: PDZ domain-containing protein [Actinomycetota bacterium]|nr:PDZ domain-containing protein [Actinomycetota bacterium]